MPPSYATHLTRHFRRQLGELPTLLALHALHAIHDLAEAEDPASATHPHPDYPADPHLRLLDTGRVRITLGIYDQLLIIEAMSVTPNT